MLSRISRRVHQKSTKNSTLRRPRARIHLRSARIRSRKRLGTRGRRSGGGGGEESASVESRLGPSDGRLLEPHRTTELWVVEQAADPEFGPIGCGEDDGRSWRRGSAAVTKVQHGRCSWVSAPSAVRSWFSSTSVCSWSPDAAGSCDTRVGCDHALCWRGVGPAFTWVSPSAVVVLACVWFPLFDSTPASVPAGSRGREGWRAGSTGGVLTITLRAGA